MNSRNFFAERKRRNVYKVALADAVVAWLLIQVATQDIAWMKVDPLVDSLRGEPRFEQLVGKIFPANTP